MFVVRKCCTDGYTLGSVLDKACVAKDHDMGNKLKLYNSETVEMKLNHLINIAIMKFSKSRCFVMSVMFVMPVVVRRN